MKYQKKVILSALNLFACVILFVCLGLAVVSGPFSSMEAGEQQFDFFHLLDRYGITIAFVLTVLFLMLLYVHQKILFETQKASAGLDGAARSLDHLDSRVRQIFEVLPVGVIETTRKGKVVFCNPMGAYLFGFDSAKDFMSAVNNSPDGLRMLYVNTDARDHLVKTLYEDRIEHCKFQDRFHHQGGKTVDLLFDLFLRYDTERDEECVFGFIQDVTDRVEFEHKLQESEARYRHLIDRANAIIVLADLSGQIRYMNEFARLFFGYTMEEVQGRHLSPVIFDQETLDESSVNSLIGAMAEGRQDASFGETKKTFKDGRKVWVSWTNNVVIENGQASEIVLIGTDITGRRALEISLKQQLQAETVLEQISYQFVNAGVEQIEESIRMSLHRIKDFCGASASYCCFFNESGFVENFYSCSFENEAGLKDFVDRFFLSSSLWWFEKLQENEFVLFSDMDEIPGDMEAARQAGRDAGLQRVCVVPVFRHDRFVGFVGLHALSSEPEWNQRQIGLMKVCGEMFLNLLEKKKFHDEISEAKERFDVAVRGAYLGMYDWDINSGDVVYNDIWFRMLGYSPREFPHTFETWKSLLHPADTARVLKVLNDYLKGTSTFYSVEYRLKTKDDSWKWILADGNIKRRGEDGAPLRMVGLHRDITELKSAELNLRYQKDLVESLIENMPAGIFAKDVRDHFRVLVWNRRMEEIFGLKRYDVLGKNDHELFDKELADIYLKDDLEVVQTGKIKSGIHERIQGAKGERWVQTVKVPVFDEDGKVSVIFGILDDVTEKEQLELSLRQTQKMQAIGQLAAGVAHEVKNPLAVILLAAEGLGVNKDIIENERIQNKVEMIKTASKKANKVIMELLRFSRLADTEVEQIDLHQVIDDAYFLAHNRGKEKYIEFQKEFHNGPLMCLGNQVLLEQVFVNLFNNAIEAIERFGRVIVRTRVDNNPRGQRNIIVEVEDNGPGIPKEILPKIFDPFYTTKEAGQGTGLGLSTVFAIMEKHNGRVRVDTGIDSGTGTRFVLTLPFSDSNHYTP